MQDKIVKDTGTPKEPLDLNAHISEVIDLFKRYLTSSELQGDNARRFLDYITATEELLTRAIPALVNTYLAKNYTMEEKLHICKIVSALMEFTSAYFHALMNDANVSRMEKHKPH